MPFTFQDTWHSPRLPCTNSLYPSHLQPIHHSSALLSQTFCMKMSLPSSVYAKDRTQTTQTYPSLLSTTAANLRPLTPETSSAEQGNTYLTLHLGSNKWKTTKTPLQFSHHQVRATLTSNLNPRKTCFHHRLHLHPTLLPILSFSSFILHSPSHTSNRSFVPSLFISLSATQTPKLPKRRTDLSIMRTHGMSLCGSRAMI